MLIPWQPESYLDLVVSVDALLDIAGRVTEVRLLTFVLALASATAEFLGCTTEAKF